MTCLSVALFNFENGGWVGPRSGFDMRPLQREFADLDEPPALILLLQRGEAVASRRQRGPARRCRVPRRRPQRAVRRRARHRDAGTDTTRHLLVLDPAPGRPLAHELVALRKPGKLRGPFPAVLDYVIYLDHHRQDHLT